MNRLSPYSRFRGLTIIDVCVVLAASVLLLGLAAPLLAQQSRETANRITCSRNLKAIALASIMYAGASTREGGKFARTYYDPGAPVKMYTGIDSEVAFKKAGATEFRGPVANDVTASLFHMMKSTDLPTDAFVCPSSDVTALPKTFEVIKKSNFPGPEHLAYSYNTPFGTVKAIQSGWKFDSALPPDHPLASDINPGARKAGGPTNVAYTAKADELASANSPNHWFVGQNVVYVDGHVEWHTTPFAGAARAGRPWRDNIYANYKGVEEKTGVGGEVTGQPQVAGDSVLLPSTTDVAEGAKPTLPVRDPAKAPK